MPLVFPSRAEWAILAAAALVFAFGADALWPAAGVSADRQAPPPGASGRFAPTQEEWAGLATERVETRVFRPQEIAEGNIAIDDDLTTPVFSPYSGRVAQLIAKLGDKVEHGAPLFAVEATEFVQAANDLIAAVAALKTARAQLTQAEINEKRAHELYLAKGGALKDWQQSQTDLAAAQNTARSAETALAAVRNRLRILGKGDREIAALEAQPTQKLEPLTIVTAPIAGIVTQRQVGLGQYILSVTSGGSAPVYTIGDLSTVWLIANIREADAARMRVGQAVEVTVPAHPGRIFKAKLSWIASGIDKDTRRLPVRADVENPDGALKPMMFASFKIITGEATAAPSVPQSAIVYEGDTARVWVAHDDRTIESRQVTTGQTSDNMVEIREGLSPGETVVTRGTLFIDRAGGTG
ncbi:MAG: efflux RND transporter periplasmic adaptor subunit [Alphaproteobacteria bacterium]|nr:efflux RND transporter periplasmic adaptor subunit [Alphaproteobacteria bacterium]